MKHIAIYARQSVEKKDSLSIEDQISVCKKNAEVIFSNIDYDVAIYYESRSGSTASGRPEFIRMINNVKDDAIDAIIVYRLDRISRNLLDFCRVWETIKKHNVQFISCSERFDTATAMGEAMLMISMVFAQMERQSIVERVTDNFFSRAEKGFYLGGYAPYGYTKVSCVIEGKTTAAYAIDKEKENTVLWIYETYANTEKSLGSIARLLAEKGAKTIFGNNFDGAGLGRMLRSPVYVKADALVYQYLKSKGATLNNDIADYIGTNGCYLYAPQTDRTPEELEMRQYRKRRNGRTPANITGAYVTLAPHEGIIDAETWLACQYKLDTNKQVRCDRAGTHSYLSGIMKCANCGYGLTVVNNNHGINYVNCYGRKKYICAGRTKAWRLEEIENYVYNELCLRLMELRNIEIDTVDEKQVNAIKSLKNEIAVLENRAEKILDEIETANKSGQTSSIAQYRLRLETVSKEIAAKNKLLQEECRRENYKSNTKIDYEHVINHWDDLSMIEKQRTARIFIKSVYVGDGEDDISILFY